jgi:hypothetical protein
MGPLGRAWERGWGQVQVGSHSAPLSCSHTPGPVCAAVASQDVTLVRQVAHDVGCPMPLASAIHDRLLGALARGRGDLDWSTGLAIAAAEDAGLKGTP